MISKLGWMAATALGMFVVATFAGIVSAGPLDPTAPPASTQRTQNDLLPAWHQDLSATGGCASARFECVLGGNAVLDRETGLVWERVPVTSSSTWGNSATFCNIALSAGKRGWRLPTVEELTSLYRTTGGLPTGHPFTPPTINVWTMTTDPANSGDAFTVVPSGGVGVLAKTGTNGRWCVRGGAGHDGY